MSAAEILVSSYAQKPLGWRPYQVDEWVAGESISLSRNLYYWRAGFPKIDNIVFKFYSNLLDAQAALLAGEIHLIDQSLTSTMLLPTYASLENEAAINVYTSQSTVFEHIDFAILPYDSRYVYFDDVEVRRAVTLCTDRQGMVDEIYAGYGNVMHAHISSSHPLYDTNFVTEWDFNLILGKSKLDGAGLLVGADGWRYKNGQRFVVDYQTSAGNSMRTTIANMFKEDMVACGIDVSIEFLPPSELFADGPTGPVFGRQFDFAQFAWLTLLVTS